jgi:hypothetical protein
MVPGKNCAMTTLVLTVLLHAAPQGAPGWPEVVALARGTEVRVQLDAGSVRGQVVDVAADTIRLRLGSDETTFDRARVRLVERQTSKPRRLRNAGIGFAAGVGVGVAAYAATCKSNCMAEGVVVWTVPLEVIGAITGAMWPSGGWQTVYRR